MAESSYMIGPGERDAFLRRKMAAELYQKSIQPQKIGHWTQGLAQMLNAGMAGYDLHSLDEKDREETTRGNEMIAKLLGGGQPAPAASAPAAMPSAAPPPPAANPMASALAAGPVAPPVAGNRPEVMPSAKVWGDKEAEAAGLYEPKPTQVAQASPPAALPPASPAPAPTVNGGTVAPGTTLQPGLNREALIAMLGNRQTRPMAQGLVQAQIAEQFKPRDQWIDERGPDGSFYQRHARTGERKVIEKSDVLPPQAVQQKIDIAKAAKPETTINNTVNPVLKGVGDRFNESMEKAAASRDHVKSIHEARRALDGGAFTGMAAEPQLFGAKVASLFGVDSSKAANTEVLRSAVGESVLSRAKTLGANPSSTDRDFIRDVVGGNIKLEENTIRRLLDMQERWARDTIKTANKTGEKLLASQPKELGNVAPLLSVEEPEDYATWSKNNPAQAAQPASVPGKVRKFNPATGKIE